MGRIFVDRLIRPDWPAPRPVRAASTLRGWSPGEAWRMLRVPGEPRWLSQVHGREVVAADGGWTEATADGCVAFTAGKACMLRTADCLPILLCDSAGTRVGAAHAGWRGLASGVIEATARALCEGGDRAIGPPELMAWIGPGIGGPAYEVGADVFRAITTNTPDSAQFFDRRDTTHWLCDLAGLARHQLRRLGIARVYGARWCTFSDPDRFHSYRRDGGSARHATFIWLDRDPGS